MAAENSDGAIVIDTELDRDGFEKGAEKLYGAVKDLTQAVEILGDNMMRSFGKMSPMLQSIANATASISERMGAAATQTAAANERVIDTEERVAQAAQSAAGAINAQGEATTTFTGAVNSSRTTVSALEREVNSLSSGIQAVAQSAETGFANGKAVLAFDSKLIALEERLENARAQLEAFGNTQIPTEAYQEITAQISKAEQALFKLYDRRDTMRDMGVSEYSAQWKRLSAQIEAAEGVLDGFERRRDRLAASGGAFISGSETAEFARMKASLDEAGGVLDRNKSLIDQEALAQARLNVLTAQEAVAAASTTAEREAAVARLQEAQAVLANLAQSMSNNPGAEPPAPDEEKITLWQRLGEGIKTVGAQALKTTGILAKIPFQAMTNGIKAFGKGLKSFISHAKKADLTSNALVKTLTSMKRLLITRIKRMFISSIFNSAKEGLQTLAKFSDSFNASMSNIKNSAKQLSGNLSVALGGLIQTLEPAITSFLNALSKAISYVNAFFALLGGKTTMTVAKKQTDSYKDSLDSAAKSAEELKAQVYGFDELNKRSGNDDKDNGVNDGSDLFEEVPIDSVLPDKLRDLFQELKDLWNDGKYFDFGKRIAEALNEVMQAVDDWINNTFRPKGVEWAGKIAEILNGFVDGFDWNLMGKTLADGLNAVFDIVNTFLTKFDFEALGKGIGEAINGWFDNIEWDLIGQTFANGWNALVNFIFGIVSQVKWDTVGDSIATAIQNFFNTIDWDKTAQTITTAINGIVKAFQHLIDGVDWQQIGQNIGKFLSDSLSGIDWRAVFQAIIDGFNSLFELMLGAINGFEWRKVAESLANGINGLDISTLLTNAAKIINDFITGVMQFVVSAIENIDWRQATQELWDSLVGIVQSIDFQQIVSLAFELLGAAIGAVAQIALTLGENIWGILYEAWESVKTYFSEYINQFGGDIIAGLWEGIKNAFINVGTWIVENIFNPFIEGFKKAFGIASPSTVMAQMGKYIVEGLLQGIKNAWDAVVSYFKTAVESIKTTLTNAWDAVKTTCSTAWENIKNTITTKFEGIKTSISTTAENVKTTISTAWNTLKTNTATAWENLKTTVKTHFDAVKQNITLTANTIKSDLTNLWNNVKQTASMSWDTIKTTVQQKFDGVKQNLSNTANTIKQNMQMLWTQVNSTASSSWMSIQSTITQRFQSIVSALQQAGMNLLNYLQRIWSQIQSSASSLWSSMTSVGSNIVGGIRSGISSAWSSVTSTFSNLGSRFVSGARSLFGIHSPSTVFAEMGEYIDLGLANGIDGYEKTVLKTVNNLANDVTDEFDASDATLRIGAEGDGMVNKLSGITAKLSDIANVFHDINTMLTGMNGLRVPAIATGTEVPYKTRVSSDTTSPVATLSNDLDERLSDFTFLLRQILDLLERAKLGVDNDELAAALAFALRGESRGFGGA